MRVNQYNVTGPEIAKSGQSTQYKDISRTGSSQGSYDAPGQVELSSLAAKLSGALSASDAQRAGRVQQLTNEMEAGRYAVDSRAVSSAIVGETLASHASQEGG